MTLLNARVPFNVAWCAGAVIGLSSGPLWASPLDRTLVPADPALILHVDVERAVATDVGRFLIEHRAEIGPLAQFDGLRVFGIDPFKDFKSVTVAAPKDKPDAGVLIVRSSPAIDTLWSHLKTEPHAKPLTVGGHELMSWEDAGKRKYGVVRSGPGENERTVYVCDAWEPLSRALDVADKKAPSDGAPAATPRSGSVVYVELRQKTADMAKPGDIPGQAMFGQLRRAVLDIGQGTPTGNVDARLTLGYDGEDTAQDMNQVAEGFKSFARLVARSTPQLKPVAGAAEPVQIAAQGAELTASASWTSDQARALLSALMQPSNGASPQPDATTKDRSANDRPDGRR